MAQTEIPKPSQGEGDDDRGLDHFRPIRLRKAADEVVSVVVNAIRGGLYEPGDRLPRERDLAERLEVSRTTIREALRILERAGIVSVRRGNNGGVFVRSRSIGPSVLEAIEGESWVNLRALLHARRVLETACGVLASENATAEDLDELEHLVEVLAGLVDDPVESIAVDLQWHLKVGYASHNPLLAKYLDEVLRSVGAASRQLPFGHIELAAAVDNQRDTLDAIKSGDRKRIQTAYDRHLGSLEEHLLGTHLSQPLAPGRPSR
jgi:GntR family transcriptional regulator, transcriptional repressor for pyruvate dehydrogenase complex